MKRNPFDDTPPDFERATGGELGAWAKRIRRQVDKEIALEKCRRPSCQRDHAPGHSHCCEGCLLDVGHFPTCKRSDDVPGPREIT